MANEEILRRIDRSLNRIDTHLEDHRTFMREMTLRFERVIVPLIERVEEGTRELREHRREFREETDAQRREFIEESRAQRAALFRILDRLDNGGAAAGA